MHSQRHGPKLFLFPQEFFLDHSGELTFCWGGGGAGRGAQGLYHSFYSKQLKIPFSDWSKHQSLLGIGMEVAGGIQGGEFFNL